MMRKLFLVDACCVRYMSSNEVAYTCAYLHSESLNHESEFPRSPVDRTIIQLQA